MASNPNNCNNCGCTPNPLDSGNWESESTVGRSTATTPPADGSLSLSPGPECKVGFTDSYVTKKWHDVTYDAKANLHPDTNCKKEDIVFSLEGETRGSTIDPGSGVVTFGPVGVILTVVVTCGEVFDKMTLLVLRVRIERQNPDDPIPGLWHDITGQKINVKVGNHIIMQAVIEPSTYDHLGSQHQWFITWGEPWEILKDYDVENESMPVIPMVANDFDDKSIDFHWTAGGSKPCGVSVTVLDTRVTAVTEFDVERPNSKISAARQFFPSVDNNPSPGHSNWILKNGSLAFRQDIPVDSGEVAWVNMIDNVMVTWTVSGVIRHKPENVDETNGLDEGFPYSTDPVVTDHPEAAFRVNTMTKATKRMSCIMYLMYKSTEKSRWVPLRSINWRCYAEATGSSLVPDPPQYSISQASTISADDDRDTTQSPDWLRIIDSEE